LRNKSIQELVTLLKDHQKERMNLRFMKASRESYDVNRVRKIRKEIARVRTLLSEKVRGENA
jgi:large subunit ribosomal protein L29